MPRDVSLSDRKCWNGGHEWVNKNHLVVVEDDPLAGPLEVTHVVAHVYGGAHVADEAHQLVPASRMRITDEFFI